MKRIILALALIPMILPLTAQQNKDAQTVANLRQVYLNWRHAMVNKNSSLWKAYTSSVRQINVRNRLWSERLRFPDAVFSSPIAPPDINSLKATRVRQKGRTAKAIYFGKVDFGVGGTPTENVFVVSYLNEGGSWKYHSGEFVKLDLLPDVKKQLKAGDYKFFDSADFHPDGKVPPKPLQLRGPVKYIAKTYVFCPGREVNVSVNRISKHLFQNTKRAEVIIGGARDGANQLQYSIKDIPGGDPKSPITIRVYLMSEVKGVKPIKIAEYQVDDGTKPKASGTLNFNVTPNVAKQIKGRR